MDIDPGDVCRGCEVIGKERQGSPVPTSLAAGWFTRHWGRKQIFTIRETNGVFSETLQGQSMKKGQLETMLKGAVDGDSQEREVWRLGTSGNRTKAPSLQLQST